MRQGLFASLIWVAILLPGCTLYTKPEAPLAAHPEVFKITLNESYSALNDHWWKNFENPQLNELVERAIQNNYDYLAAVKNIDIAQTYVLQNMTLLFPQLGVDYGFSRNKNIVNVGNSVSSAPQLTGGNQIFDLQLLAATMTYELDLWNQVHNSVEQAKADKAAAEANTNIIRITLISSVVNTYFQVTALTSNLENLRLQHKAAVELRDLTQVQYDSGLVDESKVYAASNQAEAILTTLKTAEKQRGILMNTLAYLLGEYPETFTLHVDSTIRQVNYPSLLPEAIPSVVVATRPDIQQAFNKVLSFGFIEKQNIANFFPNVSLSGTYGYANNTFSHLINPANSLWTYGLNGVQMILNYPTLYSQWKRSQIQYEAAVLSYQNAVVNAFAEVDSALVSFSEDELSRKAFRRQLENSNEILSIASAHYEAGLSNYLDYLTSDLNKLKSDYNLTVAELTVIQDLVQLYKSLGLGTTNFDPTPKTDVSHE